MTNTIIASGIRLNNMERIILDYDFVKEQILNSRNREELAKLCGCGVDKVITFIRDNGLYEFYCSQRGVKYDPSRERKKCSECNETKNVRNLRGIPYCKRHYNQMYRYNRIIDKTIYDSNDIEIDGDIAKIIIRDKYQNIINECIIDVCDVSIVSNYKWYQSGGYSVTKSIGQDKGIDIANVLFGQYDVIFDHINHNRMDNRRSNLRIVTAHQNAMNQGKKTTNTSGVIGISKQNTGKKWTATLTYNYKPIWLGCYENFDTAVLARLKGEAIYFKEFSPNYNQDTGYIELDYVSFDTKNERRIVITLDGEVLINENKNIT